MALRPNPDWLAVARSSGDCYSLAMPDFVVVVAPKTRTKRVLPDPDRRIASHRSRHYLAVCGSCGSASCWHDANPCHIRVIFDLINENHPVPVSSAVHTDAQRIKCHFTEDSHR